MLGHASPRRSIAVLASVGAWFSMADTGPGLFMPFLASAVQVHVLAAQRVVDCFAHVQAWLPLLIVRIHLLEPRLFRDG